MATYIYGLKDPNTQQIRYIGKSDNPKARYDHHLSLSKADVNKHKKHWVSSLKRLGQKPELVILERIDDKQWQDRECWWIQHGRDSGWRLTNIAEGGDYNMSGATDSIFELIDALKNYVDEDTALKLHDMPPDLLFSIARTAAMEGVKVGRGYFNNRVDGSVIYRAMRQVIVSELRRIWG